RQLSRRRRERTETETGTSIPRPGPPRPLRPPSRRSRNLAPLLTKRLRRQAHGRGQGAQIDCARARAADAAMPDQPSQRNKPARQETSLYVPVKRFLETLGFDVKGEVCGCDLVAIGGEEPPLVVIGELKLAFNLELVLQGIDRSAACDEVWLAVRTSGRRGRERDPRVRKLCRLLGFGLLGVSTSGRVELLVEPV